MLFLNNQDVERLLTMEDCIDALEDAYREWEFGRAAQLPRGGRMDLIAASPGEELERKFIWGAMAGVIPKYGIFALRQKLDIRYELQQLDGLLTMEKYCITPGTYCGLILLASTLNAEPLAIVNDGILQHLRVAATSAVAAKYLARDDSAVLGIIGSGGMARDHAQAFCSIRPIREVRVYSPTLEHREQFAREMPAKLGAKVIAVDTREAAVKGADIVAFCTDSVRPVFPNTDWVEPGMHFTRVQPGELGDAPRRADLTILHQIIGAPVEETASMEGAPLPSATEAYGMSIERERADMPTLSQLVAGKVPGRSSRQQITYFHNSPGNGIQFAAVGAKLYEKAKAQGLGRQVPTEWFLQDIRD